MSDTIENSTINNITLDKLRQLFSEDSRFSDRDRLLAELLDRIGEPSDLKIIELLNNLCKQYNSFYSDVASYEKAKEYHSCLYELFDWIVPFLNTYHKLVLYTNLCILSDDDKDIRFHNDHFDICLNKATDFVNKYRCRIIPDDVKDEGNALKRDFCKALYYLGFLNLKEHRYERANCCFEPCVNTLLSAFFDSTTKSFTDNSAKDRYFNCVVRMANCYEYQDETWRALQYMLDLTNYKQDKWIFNIASNANTINEEILKYYKTVSTFDPSSHVNTTKDNTIQIVREICKQLLDPLSDKRPLEVFGLDESGKPLNKTVKQYVHVLAHCISEYAAKLRISEISGLKSNVFPACSTLQLVSRFLLDWLVTTCGEVSLVSCQATIRAENDACPEAINLLLQRYHVLEEKKKSLEAECEKYKEKGDQLSEEESKKHESLIIMRKTSERELTELSFYLFYFSEQELRYNYKDEELEHIFNKYGQLFREKAVITSKSGDYDPLFHYYVIKVKYLLKRKAESLVRANESTDYCELDFEFANMCTLKEKCSDHIFEGLIQEYQRLVKLYSVFQKFRWLTTDTSRASVLRELDCLLSSDISQDDTDNCNETDEDDTDNSNEIIKDIDYDQSVHDIYARIRLRKRILILAPVKDAPSCSSEYEEIKEMMEFAHVGLKTEDINNPVANSFQALADYQDSGEVQLKVLNTRQDLNRLKFAIQIDTPGSSSLRINVGNNIYMYAKRNDVVNKAYRAVIPLVMEGDEVSQLTVTLNKIKNNLKNIKRARRRGGVCPRSNNHDSSYGAECCTYFIPYTEISDDLKGSLRDLLVFLEYDFHASFDYPISENDIILISHPFKHPHHFFSILVFDSTIPEVGGGKGLCSLCDSFCVEQTQIEEATIDVIKNAQEKNIPECFCKKYQTDPKQKIRNTLSDLENVKGTGSPNAEVAQLFYEKIQSTCNDGKCEISMYSESAKRFYEDIKKKYEETGVCKDANEKSCYVEEAISQWNFTH